MEIRSGENLRLILALLLVFTWIALPLYLHHYHGYPAVQVSLAITIIYYIGYRMIRRS